MDGKETKTMSVFGLAKLSSHAHQRNRQTLREREREREREDDRP